MGSDDFLELGALAITTIGTVAITKAAIDLTRDVLKESNRKPRKTKGPLDLNIRI